MKDNNLSKSGLSGFWKKIGKKSLIIVCWLLLWQLICWIVNNPIFFAGPVEMVKELIRMAGSQNFWLSVIHSLVRITGGFCIAFLAACFLAAVSYRFPRMEEWLKPFISFVKTVPVASVVVLLLIWFGAEYLSVYVTFMVVFPNIYTNVLTGLKHVDKELLEMADVFGLSARNRRNYIYRPAVMPYLLSGTKISVGMSFKSGVAAEVIGLPLASIGEGLYFAKIYLNTAGVFAWTAVIILISSLVELLVVALLKKVQKLPEVPDRREKKERTEINRTGVKRKQTDGEKVSRDPLDDDGNSAVALREVSVTFGEKKVLDHVNLELKKDGIYCIMGPSGCGKTTLLRVCAGLQKTTGGTVASSEENSGEEKPSGAIRYGMTFQEDRLCLKCSAVTNVLLAADRKYTVEEIRTMLGEILQEAALKQPAGQLSGGMKRRVAVARTVLSEAEILLLDEPFTGLDEENHERLLQWILKKREGRTLVITSHDETDADRLDAEIIRL
ncbi:MAG: ATP-binding cassette domain-containing protein [Lachnospiraceae bacterium]